MNSSPSQPTLLTFRDYQRLARTTATYPKHLPVLYPALGLGGEAGEVLEKVKKAHRDHGGTFSRDRLDAISKEIGDVLWYCANLASDLTLDLGSIAMGNLDKLQSRMERNQLKGEGDNR